MDQFDQEVYVSNNDEETYEQTHDIMDICHKDFVCEDAEECVGDDIQVMKGEPGQFSI